METYTDTDIMHMHRNREKGRRDSPRANESDQFNHMGNKIRQPRFK
jgi:hypothetical protein